MLMTRPRTAGEISGHDGRPRTPWTIEVSIAVAVAGCAPLAVLAWLLGAGAYPETGLALFSVAAAGVAGVSSPRALVPVALLMWATDDGFVIHRFGTLSLDPASGSALRVISGVSVVALGSAVLLRRARAYPVRARTGSPYPPR